MQVLEYLASRFDLGLLDSKTSRILTGILALLLCSTFVLMGRSLRKASLEPLFLLLLVGGLWSIFVAIFHKAVTEKVFLQLSTQEQEVRKFYDSMWARVHQTGIGILTWGLIIWGMIEIGISQGKFSATYILITIHIVFILFCIVKNQWIIKLRIEGASQHKWLLIIFIAFSIFISAVRTLPGLSNLIRVQNGQAALELFIFPFELALTIFASFLFLLSQFALQIAKVQYSSWRSAAIKNQ